MSEMLEEHDQELRRLREAQERLVELLEVEHELSRMIALEYT
jgi:hypothetical protein